MGNISNSASPGIRRTLPNEIILAIGDQCTPFQRLRLKQAGLQISPTGLQHSIVWSKIFKKSDWPDAMVNAGANPVLIGKDLPYLYQGTSRRIHLILLDLDFNDDGHRSLPYGHRRIFEYVQDYTWIDERAECYLNNTNIVIRFESAYRPVAGQRHTTLSNNTWSSVFDRSDMQHPSTYISCYAFATKPIIAGLYPMQGKARIWHINFMECRDPFFKELGLISWAFQEASGGGPDWGFFRYRTDLALEESCGEEGGDVRNDFIVSYLTSILVLIVLTHYLFAERLAT
jgi:hypothetical protein